MKQFWENFKSVLFWSIISAAFIGPGTVTTASKAGAGFGLQLLWALTFSILGTVVLQESAARLTIVTGKNIGEILSSNTRSRSFQLILIFLSIAFGCAAYQAGNILGAVSGLQLISDSSKVIGTILMFAIGFALLFTSNYRFIATLLGIVVAVMGFSFIYVAFQSDTTVLEFSKHAVMPSFPVGSDLLIIGLIGTTMVPYNIFLGTGISHGQELRRMRIGLIIAIFIGGFISMSIMVVGTQVDGTFSFELLRDTISSSGGRWMGVFFGIGLMAAGLSSSITSPLAAAVTAKSCFDKRDGRWSENGYRFRLVWMLVMLIGLIMGLLNLQVIPVIIAAQAINGFLLPLVACYLVVIVNRRDIMGENLNGIILNFISLAVIGVCFFIGMNNIFGAASRITSQPFLLGLIPLKAGVSVVGMVLMGYLIYKKR